MQSCTRWWWLGINLVMQAVVQVGITGRIRRRILKITANYQAKAWTRSHGKLGRSRRPHKFLSVPVRVSMTVKLDGDLTGKTRLYRSSILTYNSVVTSWVVWLTKFISTKSNTFHLRYNQTESQDLSLLITKISIIPQSSPNQRNINITHNQ